MDKVEVGSAEWNEKVMEALSPREMGINQLNGWTQAIIVNSHNMHDATFEDDVVEFECKAGSDVSQIGAALYNFAILFKRDTRAKFNGMVMAVYYRGE